MTLRTRTLQRLSEDQKTLFERVETDIIAAAPDGKIPGKDFLTFARTAKKEEDGEPSYLAVHYLVTLMVQNGVGFEKQGTPKTLFSHLTTYDKDLYVDKLLTYVWLCILSDTAVQSVSDLFNITDKRLTARRQYGGRNTVGKRQRHFLNDHLDVVKAAEELIREHQPKNAGELHRDLLHNIENTSEQTQEHFRRLEQEDVHSEFMQSLRWYTLMLRMSPANISWFLNHMPVTIQHKKLWKDSLKLHGLSFEDYKQVLKHATLGSTDHFAWGRFLNMFRQAGADAADMEKALLKVGAFREKKDGSISHKLNPVKMSRVVHGLVYHNDVLLYRGRAKENQKPSDEFQLSQSTYFTGSWWRQYPELVKKYRLKEHLSLTPLFLLGELDFRLLSTQPAAELELLQKDVRSSRYQKVAIDRYTLFCHLLDSDADRSHFGAESESITQLPREWAYNVFISKDAQDQDTLIRLSLENEARFSFTMLQFADAITYSKYVRSQAITTEHAQQGAR